MEMIDRAIPEPHQSIPQRCSAQGRTPDQNITPIRLRQHDILTRDRRAFPGAKTREPYVPELARTVKRQLDGPIFLAPYSVVLPYFFGSLVGGESFRYFSISGRPLFLNAHLSPFDDPLDCETPVCGGQSSFAVCSTCLNCSNLQKFKTLKQPQLAGAIREVRR